MEINYVLQRLKNWFFFGWRW